MCSIGDKFGNVLENVFEEEKVNTLIKIYSCSLKLEGISKCRDRGTLASMYELSGLFLLHILNPQPSFSGILLICIAIFFASLFGKF